MTIVAAYEPPSRERLWRRLASARRSWLAIDTNPRALAFAATVPGAVALWAAFVLVCAASLQFTLFHLALVSAALLLTVLAPRRRLLIISAASLLYFVLRPFRTGEWQRLVDALAETGAAPVDGNVFASLGAVAFLVFAAAFLAWQRHGVPRAFAKRPLLALIGLWAVVFGAALALPAGSTAGAALWMFAGVFVSTMWMLAYVAIDQKVGVSLPAAARPAMMRPFWGGGAEGIGKSWGYLSRFDAKTPEDLAATRLKALKLAVWALMLTALWQIAEAVLYGYAGFLPINEAVLAHAAGNSLGVGRNWASVLVNYTVDLMVISVWGHFIVATVRMLGFRIPRNTRNPLASRSIAEFWNRYFFYFKEMLVDFFFYPAFVRYFKANAKLRIAFATLCAAGMGNFLFHFMRETHVFLDRSLLDGLAVFQSAAFYSLALAAGLIVSQLRGRKARPEDGFLAYHVAPRLTVIGFFCFLKIFDDLSGQGTLWERLRFAFSLVGLTA